MDKLLQTQYFKNGVNYCKFSANGFFMVNVVSRELMRVSLLDCGAILLSLKLSDCVEIDEIDYNAVWEDAVSLLN